MFQAVRARQPGASLGRILWRTVAHMACYTWMASCYGYRVWGVRNVPRTGPVLLLSNHQSFLDPIINAIGCHHRQFYALARSSLFANPAFGWLIRSINAFPVNRGGVDLAAMRYAIGLLKSGHALLVYPEGTRTPDGITKPFASGTMLLVRRARPVVVPVAIAGAFDAWPKGRKLPHLFGKIAMEFGKPIPAQQLIEMGDEQGLEHVRQTIESMRKRLRTS